MDGSCKKREGGIISALHAIATSYIANVCLLNM